MRKYKCLTQQVFEHNEYSLVPIRDEDKYKIMQWRNDQMDILRQNVILTKEDQENYFANIVSKLFDEEKPNQLLFSFLKDGELIGYGGLVHIDWESKNGEISFLTETSRTLDPNLFRLDWKTYLSLLTEVAFKQLIFKKVYTYAYSKRSNLFPILEENGFVEEARLIDHIFIGNKYYDLAIHSLFDEALILAKLSDAELLLNWRNDEETRKQSFTSDIITWDQHSTWIKNKLADSNSKILIFHKQRDKVGQVRIDLKNECATINYLIAPQFRNLGFGKKIIQLTEKWLSKNKQINLVAEVKYDNIASQKIFETLAYRKKTELNKIVYTKTLTT